MITITSKKEGFRRCGRAHSQTPTSYPEDQFTAEELEILQQEPMLVVAVTADPEETKGASKGKAGKDNNRPPMKATPLLKGAPPNVCHPGRHPGTAG